MGKHAKIKSRRLRTTRLVSPQNTHSPYWPQFSLQNTNMIISNHSLKSFSGFCTHHVLPHLPLSVHVFLFFSFWQKSCSSSKVLFKNQLTGGKKKSHLTLPIFLVNNCFPPPPVPHHMFITWSRLPIFPARQGLPWRHSVSQSLTDGRYSKNVKEVNYHLYLTSSKAVELLTDNVNAFINYKY